MSGRALVGVVFDMDGILIDSEPLFRMAAQRAARDLGHEVTDEIYCLWMGLPPAAVEASVVETMGADFPLAGSRPRAGSRAKVAKRAAGFAKANPATRFVESCPL